MGEWLVPRNELRGLEDDAAVFHVWFATKRRKHLLVGQIEARAKQLLKEVADAKDIDLKEMETMTDHVHLMLASTSGELSAQVKMLKGVSARRLFQEYPDLRLDAHTDHFWQRGFGYRRLYDDVEGVAWYVRTQKRRLSKYER